MVIMMTMMTTTPLQRWPTANLCGERHCRHQQSYVIVAHHAATTRSSLSRSSVTAPGSRRGRHLDRVLVARLSRRLNAVGWPAQRLGKWWDQLATRKSPSDAHIHVACLVTTLPQYYRFALNFFYYLRRRLTSGEGIVALGVCVCLCVCPPSRDCTPY